ncbi:hypothetical protein [Sphingobacterium multivorum]|uniref:hypothetical protein n=1 Tax=Sphingobacterium multivorum TaxID=28454 RepID=UPI0028ACAF87|nr:hypothetical protein [Sphingobacterium multivorum]
MNYFKKQLYILCLLGVLGQAKQSYSQQLPLFNKESNRLSGDWLIGTPHAKAGLFKTKEGHLVFSNGLVSRTFTTFPNVASIGLDELTGNTAFLRSIRSEASVTIDGFTFDVGGLEGQKVHNYLLKEWIPS